MICRGEDAANDCAQKVKLSFIIFRRQRQKKAEKVSQRERKGIRTEWALEREREKEMNVGKRERVSVRCE